MTYNCPEGSTQHCFNVLGQEVPCSSMSTADLAAGMYFIACMNDAEYMAYNGGVLDLGDVVVDIDHREIVDVDYIIEPDLTYYATLAVFALTALLTTWLALRSIARL